MRVFAAIAAVGFVLAAAPAAPAAEIATIHLGAGPNDTSSEVFYAEKLGMFKRRGLDVVITVMGGGAAESAALAGGTLDVAESNVVSTSLAHERGVPFVFIAPAAQYVSETPTTELVCSRTSALKTGKDFAGKTVAVVALKDLSQLGPIAWIAKTGGDPNNVRFIEMPASAMGPALARGTIDAGMPAEPQLHVALTSFGAVACAKAFDAVAPRFMINGWITTHDWARKNPQAAACFADAIHEAALWANRNRKASAAIFKEYAKAPPELIDVMTRAVFAEKFDAGLIQPVIDATAKFGFITKAFPAAELMAPQSEGACPTK